METRASCPSVSSVINFIKKDTTIESFYYFITNNDTNFDFDINAANVILNNSTPLHMACEYANIPLVKALIKMGAYLNPTSLPWTTPLDLAIQIDNQSLIDILRKNGAKSYTKYDYLIQEDNGKGFIYAASFVDAVSRNVVEDAAEILNKQLICLNYCDTFNGSQLRIAAEKGYFDMVKLLVSYGGGIIEKYSLGDIGTIPASAIGVTTAEAARKNNHYEIADYLEQLQKERYEKLKVEVKLEKYHEHGKIFMLGLFADRNSHLSQGLGEASRDIATKIFSFV